MLDEYVKELSSKHFDLSRSLNEQGYYGPLPNDADPRANPGLKGRTDSQTLEYYEWVEQWCRTHNYKFDNAQMCADREEYLRQVYPGNHVIIW